MKNFYYKILTLLTFVLMLALVFFKVNDIAHFVDTSSIAVLQNFLTTYCPLILLCMFAFVNVVAKWLKTLLAIAIVLIILVFVIATFKPEWIEKLFNKQTEETARFLLNL